MTNEEITKLLKNAKPLKIPKIKTPEKTCTNCQDMIVCYGFDEPTDIEKAKTCPDWHLDFMTYQDMIDDEILDIP